MENNSCPNCGATIRPDKPFCGMCGHRIFSITVNGRKKTIALEEGSFADIVALAFNPVPRGPYTLFTVTYGRGPKANREGMLLEGEAVQITDGMVFGVTQTDKS